MSGVYIMKIALSLGVSEEEVRFARQMGVERRVEAAAG
jgi:hypothetical protein